MHMLGAHLSYTRYTAGNAVRATLDVNVRTWRSTFHATRTDRLEPAAYGWSAPHHALHKPRARDRGRALTLTFSRVAFTAGRPEVHTPSEVLQC